MYEFSTSGLILYVFFVLLVDEVFEYFEIAQKTFKLIGVG